MKKYFNAMISFGIPSFIYLISGIIKNKIVALVLKTEGLGVISMGSYAINTIVPISTMGLQLSVLKYSAESKSDTAAHRVLLTALFFVLVNSLMATIFFIIFREQLSLWIFSSPRYFYAVILIALAIPFYSLSEILIHYFKGRKFISSIALGNSITAILSLSIGIPLIYFFKTEGGFLQIFSTGVLSFIIALIFVFRGKITISDFLSKIPDFLRLSKVLYHAGFILYFVPRILYVVTLFLVKIMIVRNFNFNYNGIYESAILLSTVCFSFFSDTLLGFFLPSICNDVKIEKKEIELNQVIRLIVFISVPMVILVSSYAGKFLINVFFSKQFLPAFEFLPIRFIGDYFFIINSAIMYVFMSNSNYKIVTFVSILYNISMLGLSFFLPRYLGFKGYFIAYLATTFSIFVVTSYLLKKKCLVNIFKKNYNVILLSAFLMLASLFLAQNKYLQFMIIPLLIIWLLLSFSFKELKGFFENIKKFIMLNNRLTSKMRENCLFSAFKFRFSDEKDV